MHLKMIPKKKCALFWKLRDYFLCVFVFDRKVYLSKQKMVTESFDGTRKYLVWILFI